MNPTEKKENLYKILSSHRPEIEILDWEDRVRNHYKTGLYNGVKVIVKVGDISELENLKAFENRRPDTKSFKLPALLEEFEFIEGEQSYICMVYEYVDAKSLEESVDLIPSFDQRIIEIVKEIDSFKDLNLPRSADYLERFKKAEGQSKFCKETLNLMQKWFDSSDLKFEHIYERASKLLIQLDEEETYELGTIHGELNLRRILPTSDDEIQILDWEKVNEKGLRYFDMAEYLARIIVFVPRGIMMAEALLNKFLDQAELENKDTFRFALMHKVIGSLYEQTERGLEAILTVEDEEKVLRLSKGF